MSSDSSGNSCRRATRSDFSRSTSARVLVAAALPLVQPLAAAAARGRRCPAPRRRPGSRSPRPRSTRSCPRRSPSRRRTCAGSSASSSGRRRPCRPTRPVFSRYASIGWVASSSRMRLPWRPCGSGKNGFVPGTRRNLPASAAPPAAVPVVSPEHEVRGGLLLVQLGHGGDDVLVPVEDQQVVDRADVARVLDTRSRSLIPNTARPFCV